MNTTQNNNKNKRRWIKWHDILIVLVILAGVHFWQTRDSLSTAGDITAPDFKLPTLNGNMIDSRERHNAPSVYYFFAPWCNICHLSIENLNTIKEEIHSGKINAYIIALDWRTKEEVAAFVEQHDLPVEVLLGTSQQQSQFNIKGFPTYYISDESGIIRWASVGYSTSLGLRSRLKLTD